MLWSPNKIYQNEPFEIEDELRAAILEVNDALFGTGGIYLDTKRRMGENIPDGYLIDIYSRRKPKLYIVEIELAIHRWDHIAGQITGFAASFANAQPQVKEIVRNALELDQQALEQCQNYAVDNNFQNVDRLLDRIIYAQDAFNVLVIIDEMSDSFERRFANLHGFPVETIILQRYSTPEGETIYQFEPFFSDIAALGTVGERTPLDRSEIDTIVVPAQEDGFQETFIGENCWYEIRIHATMIPQIKYIAAYRVAPRSAITHFAEVRSIERMEDSNKYILYFTVPASTIGPINLVPNGHVKAPRAPRYTSRERLQGAKNLDEAF